MIANDKQLDCVRRQVGRLEAAVHSLSRTVRPQSERQFRVLAEGYVDQLRVLRDEIDVYLGVAAVTSDDAESHAIPQART